MCTPELNKNTQPNVGAPRPLHQPVQEGSVRVRWQSLNAKKIEGDDTLRVSSDECDVCFFVCVNDAGHQIIQCTCEFSF